RRIESEDYDVWLFDYRLGAHSGLDLLQAAAKQGCEVPVILLTGQGDREVDLQAAQLGAWDYLSKQELELCPKLLERAIRYGIASKQHEKERVQLALAREAQRQAEAANHAKEEFLGMVSHELRGPLNAMLLWAGVLHDPNVDPATRSRALAAIERSATQQTRMLEDLLDINRIVRGTLRIDKRPLDLAAVAEAAIATVRTAAAQKSIALDLSCDAALGQGYGDPGRLEQVLNNLLSNSIKFTPEGGRIEVRIERATDTVQPLAQITVTDTGQGISGESLPYVFDRYRQAEVTGRQTGLGLGLAIVRSLVELHGGNVHAASSGEGQGATFTVRLPLATRTADGPGQA
ncbi:MAG: ATP-binding protein, partial [Gammaproteobacteria bacterium]